MNAALQKSKESTDPDEELIQQVIIESTKAVTQPDDELQRIIEMSMVEK